MSLLFALLVLGLVSGFIAGLLGVGGGLVMVPVLVVIFAQQGFDAAWHMHLALGTSLAVIVLTSIASLRAHHAHGAVRWQTVKRIAPGIVIGTLIGALLARHFSDLGLRVFFVAFLFFAATQMWLEYKPHAQRELPGRMGMT
ncbi:MAG: sulfite exporter TauE/SafE family protein, partial [Betaproteobacteria bacterium]